MNDGKHRTWKDENPWRDPEHWYLNADGKQMQGQLSIFDMEEK